MADNPKINKKAQQQAQKQVNADMAKFLWVKMLKDRVPELGPFWDEINAHIKKNKGITPDEFNNYTRKYSWFTKVDGDRQAAEVAMAQDRANNTREYEDSIQSSKPALRDTFAKFGVDLDDDLLDTLARQARYDNWSAEEIKSEAGRRVEEAIASGANMRGAAGDAQVLLSEWARKNGLNLSPQQLAGFVRRGVTGQQSIDDAKQEIRNMYLKGMFPSWVDYIDRGLDPEAIAAPYRQKASAMLGLPEDALTFDDPIMKKAMQGVNKDGKPATVPLWEYERMVREDPRWQYSDDAYSTVSNTIEQVGRMFGFR